MRVELPVALDGPSPPDVTMATPGRLSSAGEYAEALLRSAHRQEALLVAVLAALDPSAVDIAPKPKPAGKPAKGG